MQIFSVGFVAGLKQQYRRDLLQGSVNPRMATAVGNDQVWFQGSNGFQARLRARSDGLPRFQVRTHFGQDAFCIVIVGNTDRADVHGGQRIGEREFQHHNPLWRFIECKRAVFVLNRGGKGVADHQQQACKKKTDKCQHSHIPAKSPASRALTHQNFNDPCIYSVRGWPA